MRLLHAALRFSVFGLLGLASPVFSNQRPICADGSLCSLVKAATLFDGVEGEGVSVLQRKVNSVTRVLAKEPDNVAEHRVQRSLQHRQRFAKRDRIIVRIFVLLSVAISVALFRFLGSPSHCQEQEANKLAQLLDEVGGSVADATNKSVLGLEVESSALELRSSTGRLEVAKLCVKRPLGSSTLPLLCARNITLILDVPRFLKTQGSGVTFDSARCHHLEVNLPKGTGASAARQALEILEGAQGKSFMAEARDLLIDEIRLTVMPRHISVARVSLKFFGESAEEGSTDVYPLGALEVDCEAGEPQTVAAAILKTVLTRVAEAAEALAAVERPAAVSG